jgi:hypothetical protein
MDPDLVRFNVGDAQLEQYSRNKDDTVRRKRMATEFNEHHKLVNSLQKLNFMKGLFDDNSPLSLMPFDEYIYEQVKLLNFVYNNIFTRYHQQEKMLAKSKVPRPLALKNEKYPSSDEGSPVVWRKGVDSVSTPWRGGKKKSKRKKKSKKRTRK